MAGGSKERDAGADSEPIPLSLALVGSFWIAMGLLLLGSAVLALAASWALGSRVGVGSHGPPVAGAVLVAYRCLGSLQILAALFTIYGAVSLLRRRSWARTVLELLSWLGLGAVVVFAIALNLGLVLSGGPVRFAVLSTLAMFVAIALLGAPFGLVLLALRGPTVRDAMG